MIYGSDRILVISLLKLSSYVLKTNIYSYGSQDLKNVINLIFIRKLN